MNKLTLSAALLSLPILACSTAKQPITLIPVHQATASSSDSLTEESLLPNATAGFTYDYSPEIRAAIAEYSNSGKAPIVKRAGFVQFPFGEVQPILNCQKNYGCDIELQPGEKVSAVILGNEPLWDFLIWESNQNSTPVAHVTISPRVGQTTTNAIIGTDRRTYHLELISTANAEYVRSAKFYYPRERLKEFQAAQKQAAKKSNHRTRMNSNASARPYEVMSFNWEVHAPRSVKWKPKRVFDDGAHIYIQFPENVIFEDFPGVYTPTADGGLSSVTWRTVSPDPSRSQEKGSYLMVDGMFEELQLLGGFRGKQQTITIKRTR